MFLGCFEVLWLGFRLVEVALRFLEHLEVGLLLVVCQVLRFLDFSLDLRFCFV